jgi:hypothetical protein
MTWSDIPRNPSRTTLRQFAGLWLVFFGGLGCRHLLGQDPSPAGWLLVALALLAGLPGLIRPRLMRPLFVGWMIAVFPVGWMISRLVLGAIFYGVFTPLGLWFRFRGRDPLRLKRGAATSYWMPKPTPAGAASYYHQF